MTAVSPHRWLAPADPRWFGFAGPHGGHLAAQLLRAMVLEAADPELGPRSLTVHFASRARPGDMEVETRIERRGRSMSTAWARATQGDRVVALAMAALASPRRGPAFREIAMPDVPPPDQLSPPPLYSRPGPRARDNYEMRVAIGQPLSGEAARTGGWIRLCEPRPPDHLLTTALADMWMPAVIIRLRERVPTTTVELTVNYLDDPDGLPDDAWFLATFEAPVVQGGFVREEGTVWGPDGQVLARCSQLAAFLVP